MSGGPAEGASVSEVPDTAMASGSDEGAPGERLADPDLGTPDPVFTGLDPEEVTAIIAQQEPRASLSIVTRQLKDVQHVRVAVDNEGGAA